MIQLIAHLIGDFVLQNDWMASNKNKFDRIGFMSCFWHCCFYTASFAFITLDPMKLLLIWLTHYVIDKFSLAKHWCNFFKVGARFDWSNWIKIYLIFMVDMCFHLICNYVIL